MELAHTMPFSQEKATAAAAFLLQLRGGRMSYLKLIKLLYLADREALHRWGFNVTTDRYVSMDHGPVVSNIYNLVIDERDQSYWSQYISPPMGNYEVALKSEALPDQLSRAEMHLLEEVFGAYGTWNRWKLVDFTHKLPEWRDPQGSSTPITIPDILKAQGESEEDIEETLSDLRAFEKAESLLGEH